MYYCSKINKYCPRSKFKSFDKTSILNENADVIQCSDCIYFFSKNCENNLDDF